MLDKLNFFIILAGERHFGKAALKLGITQPSLSAAIRQLEENLGVMLVNRGSRFQGLTEEGERVLNWALKITADTRTMKEEIQNRTKGLSGTLTIGAIPTAMTAIPEITNSFLSRHPNVKLKLLSQNSNEVLGSLERFEIDVGITYLNNEPSTKLKSVAFYSESYQLITPFKSLNRHDQTVSWSAAAKLRLCLLTNDMQNRRILNQRFLEDGISIMPALEANSLTALFTHVQTGQWSSILPETLIKSLRFNKDVAAIPMQEPQMHHKIGLIALRRDPNTPLITTFLKEAEVIALKKS